MAQKLQAYRTKRNFARTPEPRASKKSKHAKPIFVVHKHDARTLHYDFRLEIDGVLASWAVPKGPTFDSREKRLAVETEDHPLSYASFEGAIPEGEYGAGLVLVWDTGTYKNVSTENGEEISMRDARTRGMIEMRLSGKKLRGTFVLTKMKGRGRRGAKNGKDNWLLIKKKDEHADARRNVVNTEPDSVLSHASLEDIQKEIKG